MQAEQDGIYFGSIPDESGLSQKTISCIFQDKKGFLWFGTRDGLNRFDGSGLCELNCTHAANQTSSVSGLFAQGLFVVGPNGCACRP
jgi:ligand-binding sensor domain-containing protein